MLNDQDRQEVGRIHATLQAKLDAARADKTVTTRERHRQMARALLSARSEMAAIRDASSKRTAIEQGVAYRKLFGIRPDRSAEDRAYRDSLATRDLSADEATAMYNQAAARGDDVAMTALAELAWANSGDELGGTAWHPILDAYRITSNDREAAMNDLVELVNPGKLDQLRDRMTLEVSQPSDLPGNLDFLASDAETPTSMPGDRPMGQNWNAG